MIRTLIPAAALLTLAACSQPAPAPQGPAVVAVTDALCRPTPNGRDTTACYAVLTASTDDRLVSVASPIAGKGEVHEMKTENEVMSMAELKDGLPLPAGQAVTLAPGGTHIMLFELATPLAVGDTMSLTLTFEHAEPLGVRATVGQPATTALGGH